MPSHHDLIEIKYAKSSRFDFNQKCQVITISIKYAKSSRFQSNMPSHHDFNQICQVIVI